jgi:AcrR family transcriptional regulator
MPKIIENLKADILKEAKRQVFNNGYSHMTLRSVAKACDIAVGTIYNYYSSKDVLIATFILQDWWPIEKSLRDKCDKSQDIVSACHEIYLGLLQLEQEYQPLFEQEEAIKLFGSVFPKQHQKLRIQLAEMLQGPCKRNMKEYVEFMPEFLAESLLAWATEKRKFSDIETVLNVLLK